MITQSGLEPMENELREFFDTLDPECEFMKSQLDAMFDATGGKSALYRKTEAMRILEEKSKVHVFRFFPFWSQFSAGRIRYEWGGLGCPSGGQYICSRLGAEYEQGYYKEMEPLYKEGYVHGWGNPVGHDHHALNYDDILTLGLEGIAERMRRCRDENPCPDTAEFYEAALKSLDILKALSLRFADEAGRMAEAETDPEAKRNLLRIAESAAYVPMHPARTFYEALAAIFFCREAVGTLEGIGVSTFGQVDRMLTPYYERDAAAGRITREEAKKLFHALLMYTAVRFDENGGVHETSTTIIVGGCDRDGTPVYSEATRILLDAECEGRYVNTKFDCRISRSHPEEYLRRLCGMQASGLAVMVLMNDETHIAARVRRGQDVHDARLYVAGGCHEIVLGGTEVCTRADTWISPVRVLNDVMAEREFGDFEEFYSAVTEAVKQLHILVENRKNAREAHWPEFDPMPLYSCFLTGCAESGKDASAGGSKYANTAFSITGNATYIDSLWAVKKLVFDEKRITLAQYRRAMEEDFANDEALRRRILALDKHGTGCEELDAFTQRVYGDLEKLSYGRCNARGGKYMPAFYAHNVFVNIGQKTGATPDGRHAGAPLSRGVSPSEFIEGHSPTDLIRSVYAADYTAFTDSSALEMTLPPIPEGEAGAEVLLALVKEFLNAGGSTLQFNVLDVAALRDAQRHPELHRDIIVRVCGFSDYFVNLHPSVQNEVMSRALRAV